MLLSPSEIRGRALRKKIPELIEGFCSRQRSVAFEIISTDRRLIERNDRHVVGLPIDVRRRAKTREGKKRRRAEVPQFIHCASLAQSSEFALVRAICPFVKRRNRFYWAVCRYGSLMGLICRRS